MKSRPQSRDQVARQRNARHRGRQAKRRLRFEMLEVRLPLAADFGDAPDLAPGAGAGEYQTRLADGGPSHTVPATPLIFLGAGVDTENDALTNPTAEGDDKSGPTDDEDGVNNPLIDLLITSGSTPSVNVSVTNNTATDGTLSGWIDYNQDGVFDNGTERAQATVLAGTQDAIATLTFPTAPFGFYGDTYARFRLSTDSAADEPVGAAADGEVEDYRANLIVPSDGGVATAHDIKQGIGGFGGTLDIGDTFGSAIADMGDIDGDGISDLAVGAESDDDGGTDRGAVWILFMQADGTVKAEQKISNTTGGLLASLSDSSSFGASVANAGDIDGDGINELAVGSPGLDGASLFEGAVWILTLNSDGTVKEEQKIGIGEGGFSGTFGTARFGSSIGNLGDLDRDGVNDLVVGAVTDSDGGGGRGAIWVLFMNADGTVKSNQKISATTGGFSGALDDFDFFGKSVANLGDLNHDGITELAVGANQDDDGGPNRGAVWILFMNADGTVGSHQKISDTSGGFGGDLDDTSHFGDALAGPGDLDGDGVNDLAVGAPFDQTVGAVWLLSLNPDGTVRSESAVGSVSSSSFGTALASSRDWNRDGESDLLVGSADAAGSVTVVGLASVGLDFADAPDSATGVGPGNYNTLASDNGPLHYIDQDLFLGTRIDGETDAFPNVHANGDDADLEDDEDALNNPLFDLVFTAGTQPTLDVRVTNTTGSPAMLSGWIDYNGDGQFSSDERAQRTITGATADATLPLTFPTVPFGHTGTTYVRFRLSTDPAGEEATGFAADGEVEDYRASIVIPTDPTVKNEVEIGEGMGGFGGSLSVDARFGSAVTSLGDIDGDGVGDLAAGAPKHGTAGAVWVLLMNADGTVKSEQQISSTAGGFGGGLATADQFGAAVAGLGDLDGDTVPDLAVGAPFANTTEFDQGSVWILFLNSDGTVKAEQKIDDVDGGFNGVLNSDDHFGNALASLGDLNGDGVRELAVGVVGDDSGGGAGAAWILFMKADGTVNAQQKIGALAGGFGGVLDSSDSFADSLAHIGDMDGDGLADLAVGASGDDDGGTDRGAVWILLLNADGTVKSEKKISDTAGGFGGTLNDGDEFGGSITDLGDIDADGVRDLAVGARHDGDGGADRGAVWVLRMDSDGTVKSEHKVSQLTGGFGGTLQDYDSFGHALANAGDLNGDGVTELAVGTEPFSDKGSLWLLKLSPAVDFGDAPDAAAGSESGDYNTRAADNGPVHRLSNNLFLGSEVDTEADAQPTSSADGDDLQQTPDDEDGLVDPVTDLTIASGTGPEIRLTATNLTLHDATLSGWIDYNADGVFAVTERAQLTVPAGTNNGNFTLQFPTAFFGFRGTTYARFRLSRDAAAAEPTGYAADGEVEDYIVTLDGKYVVNSAGDASDSNLADGRCDTGALVGSGRECTLRAAIQQANAAANGSGNDRIHFNIPGVGVHTMTPASPLPTITEAVTIDATTQPGYNGTPLFELDGSAAGAAASGLTIVAGNTKVGGLAINRFAGSGIILSTGGGNTIQQNMIGVDAAGMTDLGNSSHGITIFASASNLIGGPTTLEGNVISANGGHGVFITKANSTSNLIEGNRVGVGFDGDKRLGNDGAGVRIDQGASSNVLQNQNIISSNGTAGVLLAGSDTMNNSVLGNFIGTDASGVLERGNGSSGVTIDNAPGNSIGAPGNGNFISGNAADGVFVTGTAATGNLIQSNLIGTDASSLTALPNGQNGVAVNGAPDNHIGGILPGAGNVLSGNADNGVFLVGATASGNFVRGNFIGTDDTGSQAVANGAFGIVVRDAPANTVGGAGSSAGNVISGNVEDGVAILNSLATGNEVSGNWIGTDSTGSTAVGNGKSGVLIWKAPANHIGRPHLPNVISGNGLFGVRISTAQASGNVVLGNFIGTNSSGNAAVNNLDSGIQLANAQNTIIGGSGAGEANIISGNNNYGIVLTGAGTTGNTILGNGIGSDLGGTATLGNASGGIRISDGARANVVGGDSTLGEGNTIVGNGGDGVFLVGTGTSNNTLVGNTIGVTPASLDRGNASSGIVISDASENTIGGTSTGAGNVISDNGLFGVAITGANATGNRLEGNLIGTDTAGTLALGNDSTGVLIESPSNTVGGTTSEAGNVISGNHFVGVRLKGPLATGNVVRGNLIGTQIDGALPLPNQHDGVRFEGGATGNELGGAVANSGNVIAHNTARGVGARDASTGNSVRGNSIFSNNAVGIDLGLNGATANDTAAGNEDADAGPNNLQNTPVLTQAIHSGNDLDVSYSVPSNTSHATYPLTIEFFLADLAGGEGKTLLGSDTYSAGEATSSVTVALDVAGRGLTVRNKLVATATDAAGNTSEFSPAINVSLPLRAVAGPNAGTGASQLAAQQPAPNFQRALQSAVEVAFEHWQAVGLDRQQASFPSQLEISFAELDGAYLGLATRNSIVLDDNAAGYGWFVDPRLLGGAETSIPPTGCQAGKLMDLLTVVMHEMGHVIGLPDLVDDEFSEDVMFAWLEPGQCARPQR